MIMEDLLNLYNPERFNNEIEELVERTKMSYLDAILHYAEVNNLESETIASLINISTKNKLREEAESLHFLPKTSKLPL